MTEADRRERDLEWIAREFHYQGGAEMAEILRSGTSSEREAVLAKLEDAARAERARGIAGHWAYSLPRHQHLVEIIERERALLAAEELKAARRRYQAAGRRLRHQLYRHGQASISLLRRLGTARGTFLAAIAGRKEGDAR